ncbi:MAG: hypothetical protein GX978_06800 [Tissierellia bacterium]|jgi:cell division protein FtsL|nr:hypothetical protein [Tissierellia bacterium]
MKLDFREFDKAYNEDIDRRLKEKETKHLKRKELSRVRQFYLYGLVVALAIVVIASTVYGYVELNRIKFDNERMINEIYVLESEIAELQYQLDQETSSSVIVPIAQEKLGLVKISDAETQSVEVRIKYALNPDAKNVIVKEDLDKKAADNQ